MHERSKSVGAVLLAAAFCAARGLTFAQSSTAPLPHESATSDDATASDPTVFIKSAAMGQLTAMALAKLAVARSKDAAIRNFAARIIEDSRAANLELSRIAKPKGFDVPTVLDGEDQSVLTVGASKRAAEFDPWYTAQMISEQAKAVALFQEAVNSVDLDLAGFAKKALPALMENQKRANVLPMAVNQ